MLPRTPRSTLFPYTTLFRSTELDDRKIGSVRHALELEDEMSSHASAFPQSTRRVAARERVSRTGLPSDTRDRKSTRLNSSHRCISYAVFCLKKKKKKTTTT